MLPIGNWELGLATMATLNTVARKRNPRRGQEERQTGIVPPPAGLRRELYGFKYSLQWQRPLYAGSASCPLNSSHGQKNSGSFGSLHGQ